MRLNTIIDTIERLIREINQASTRYALHVGVPEVHDTQGRAEIYRKIDNWQRELSMCLYKLGSLRQGAQYRNYQLNVAKLSHDTRYLRKTSDQEVKRLRKIHERAMVAKDALVGYINQRARLSDMEFDSLVTDLLSNMNDWGDNLREVNKNEVMQIAQSFNPSPQQMHAEIKPVAERTQTPQTTQGNFDGAVIALYVTLRCIQLMVKKYRS
ncbi:MAG: hypothetical protein HKN70_11825 [Gammaproteobacteria bacterium]|nr:hypothetical protein [Gammaproteobacteria bacterium]